MRLYPLVHFALVASVAACRAHEGRWAVQVKGSPMDSDTAYSLVAASDSGPAGLRARLSFACKRSKPETTVFLEPGSVIEPATGSWAPNVVGVRWKVDEDSTMGEEWLATDDREAAVRSKLMWDDQRNTVQDTTINRAWATRLRSGQHLLLEVPLVERGRSVFRFSLNNFGEELPRFAAGCRWRL